MMLYLTGFENLPNVTSVIKLWKVTLELSQQWPISVHKKALTSMEMVIPLSVEEYYLFCFTSDIWEILYWKC